ncbi:MAG TPA: hybrid sensor histidine kinase/response regulator [Roseateles sp.]
MTPAGRQPALARRLFMARAQTLRSQLPIAIAHAVVAWALWRDGLAAAGLAWFVTITGVNLARSLHLLRLTGDSDAQARHATRVALNWLVVIGLLRPVPVLLTLLGPRMEDLYLITLVMLGLTVGGASNLAGLMRLYDAWTAPLFLALGGVWLARADVEGTVLALLLGMMFFLIRGFVRDYGAVLAREMDLAEQLRLQRDRAEDAIVAKGRFFAAASHDLRQPIAAMRWYGEAVEEHARMLDHAGLKQIGEGMARAMARADPLLAQYLEISRLEAHEAALPLVAVDLGALLQQTADAWAPQARQRGLGLVVEAAPSAIALGDEASLRRILDNLVANAIKFTPAGRVTLAVEAAVPGRWRTSVSDTGIGIAPADHGRVFEDFFQIGNAARATEKGVGLGLSIASRHAGRLGSSLRLSSALGQGCRFEFDLVAAPAPPMPSGAAQEAQDTLPMALKFLVVDDDTDVRQALKSRLEARGWSVQTASAAQDALALWREGFAPDVVLADHRLGDDRTGVELIAALRAAGCGAPAVLITGDTMPEHGAQLARSGLEVLHKPVNDTVLVQAVARLLKVPESRRCAA